jgi:hypothetical protein
MQARIRYMHWPLPAPDRPITVHGIQPGFVNLLIVNLKLRLQIDLKIITVSSGVTI